MNGADKKANDFTATTPLRVRTHLRAGPTTPSPAPTNPGPMDPPPPARK